MAQSVKSRTSAQVMISWFMGLSPVLGSVLAAQSLEPVSNSVFPCPSPTCTLSLSLSKINKYFKKFKKLSNRSAWVTQSVECLTFDCGSSHHPGVMRWSPTSALH